MIVRILTSPKEAENGLRVEGNKSQMLSPFTTLIQGNSHANGGTMINFNGQTVEAEAGEPFAVNSQGDGIVFGNLEVPGTNKKFKALAKDIAKQENKAAKLAQKGSEHVMDSNPYHPIQALKYNAGTVLQDAANQITSKALQEKEMLGNMQQFMLNVAEDYNISPDKVSKTMKNGGTLDKLKKNLGTAESSDNYFVGNDSSSAFGKYQFLEGTRKDYYNKYYKNQYPSFSDFNTQYKKSPELQEDLMGRHLQDLSNQFEGNEQWIALAHRLGPAAAKSLRDKGYYTSNGRKVTLDTPIGSSQKPTDKETPSMYLKKLGLNSGQLPDFTVTAQRNNQEAFNLPLFNTQPQQGKPFGFSPLQENQQMTPTDNQVFSQGAMPFLPQNSLTPQAQKGPGYQQRTKGKSLADMNKLGIAQILPELATIADRPGYVQAIPYNPQLLQPYQVSFQDRLNQNQSTFRALSRNLANNPEALASLAAQKYAADNQVLSEQFRVNQGINNQVLNQNIGTLNDAQLKNLAIRDQQYGRQEQARSNTRNRQFQAAQSIASKIGQNQRENIGIKMQENLFNYRYNPVTGEMDYTGPTSGEVLQFPSNTPPQSYDENITYDAYGKPVKRVKKIKATERATQSKFGTLLNKMK